jgi:hypothetical protein
MDTIEKTLVDIETQMEDAICKQKLTVANTVHNVARDSVVAGYSLDMEFMNVFPELKDLCPDVKVDEPINGNAFNPKFVIEVREGKGVGVVSTWDTGNGLLPNRKVMGKYYIDVGKPQVAFVHNPHVMYCVVHNVVANTTNNHYLYNGYNPNDVKIDCGCHTFGSNIQNHMYGATKLQNPASINRGEHRELFEATATHTFEVDNYLNLYHPQSGLYLLFNKTSFPAFPFLARPNIFQSKRHHHDPADIANKPAMKFVFDNAKYTSMDSRAGVLAAVTELIPDDYYKVIDFYDRFRKMTAFKKGLHANSKMGESSQKTGDGEVDSEVLGPDGKIPVDARDSLIRELENRLAAALKQIELTDSYNNELVSLYQKQTDELMDVTRKLNQLTANQTTETARRRLEDNAQVFTLKKQLADAQSCIVRSRIQGDALAKLETELADCRNETAKLKDLNNGLTDQLLATKRELKLKAEEIASSVLVKNRTDIQNNTLLAEKTKLQNEVTTLMARIKDLDGRLLQVTQAKPDKEALEQVLTARCEELTKENKGHVDRLAQVQRELVAVQTEYAGFRSRLTQMMTSK